MIQVRVTSKLPQIPTALVTVLRTLKVRLVPARSIAVGMSKTHGTPANMLLLVWLKLVVGAMWLTMSTVWLQTAVLPQAASVPRKRRTAQE